MKRIVYLSILSIFLFASCEKEEELIDLNAEKQLPKVEVCHYDAYTNTWKTISIPQNALKAHLAHGDFIGSCGNRKTYVPDNNFEGYLICKGYDDVMDDYVLTSNIDKIEILNLPFDGGSDCDPVYPLEYAKEAFADLTGLQDFVSLKELSCSGDLSGTINLSAMVNLEKLRIYAGYGLTSLDLSNCKKLKSLRMGKPGDNVNGLIQLDLTSNLILEDLQLEYVRNLIELDLSHNSNLKNFLIKEGNYINIDLSANSSLMSVNIESCALLQGINLKNGNNMALSYYVTDNTVLSCIQVDDAAWSETNWAKGYPSSYIFSEDCGF